MNKNITLLVGVGYMGIEYAKVLKSLNKPFVAIGRGRKNTLEFEKQTGISAETGGIIKWLNKNHDVPQHAIVASTEDTLGTVTIDLIKYGIKNILVEKPGAFDEKEIVKIAQTAKKRGSEVYVGYNRRFYSSVTKGLEIIKRDGGITSFFFDFTEWGHVIEKLKKDQKIKEKWFLHNSTHVIDMAFFMCGWPIKMTNYTNGSLDWHPKASSFSGAGVTDKNIPFSYIADWGAPGRWSIEIMTKKHKLIYKPLEKLQVQNKGSVAIENIEIDDKLDIQFKPGLYKQIQSFFGNKHALCTINQQVQNIKVFQKIAK